MEMHFQWDELPSAHNKEDKVSFCSPRLECSGTIMVYCSLDLPGSVDPPPQSSKQNFTLVTQAGMQWHNFSSGARHHAQLIFVFLVEMSFHQVGQTGLAVSPWVECSGTVIAHCSLELLDSSDFQPTE
ncbi:hypothetical protein AAY473_010198 [Plecturocebus cupreus]